MSAAVREPIDMRHGQIPVVLSYHALLEIETDASPHEGDTCWCEMGGFVGAAGMRWTSDHAVVRFGPEGLR